MHNYYENSSHKDIKRVKWLPSIFFFFLFNKFFDSYCLIFELLTEKLSCLFSTLYQILSDQNILSLRHIFLTLGM